MTHITYVAASYLSVVARNEHRKAWREFRIPLAARCSPSFGLSTAPSCPP